MQTYFCKLFCKTTAILLFLTLPFFLSPQLLSVVHAATKSSGGFSSSSSSSSEKKTPPPKPQAPANSATKKTPPPPPAPTPAPTAPAKTSGSFSNQPATKNAATAPPESSSDTSSAPSARPVTAAKQSDYDKSVNRQISSAAYSKSAAQAPSTIKTTLPAYTNSTRYSQTTLSQTRQQYCQQNHYTYIPTYTYSHNPWGFGSFYLNMLIYDALFAHHHHDDPAYQAWRMEANEKALTDASLQKQLSELDAKVNALEAQGVERDPSYLPQDLDPALLYPDQDLLQENKLAQDKSSSSALYILPILALGAGGYFFVKRSRKSIAN